MIATALVRHTILKWFLMVSKSVFESFLITAQGTLTFDNFNLSSAPILSSKRNLLEIGFKGIHFEAENQFHNLSKETEVPPIQGHPKDRDQH